MRNVLVAVVIGIIFALAIWVSWKIRGNDSAEQPTTTIAVLDTPTNQTVNVAGYAVRLSPNQNKIARLNTELVQQIPVSNPTVTPAPVVKPQSQATNTPIPATIAPLPTDTPTPRPIQSCNGTPTTAYIVQQGDSLQSIAQKYNATIALMAECDIASGDIRVGNTIYVPTYPALSLSNNNVCTDNSIKHTVSKGENVFRIGLRYGVDKDAIRIANNLNANYLIYPGDVLCIP